MLAQHICPNRNPLLGFVRQILLQKTLEGAPELCQRLASEVLKVSTGMNGLPDVLYERYLSVSEYKTAYSSLT